MSKIYTNEEGYIDLVRDVLENGVFVPDRTGEGTIAVFDRKIIYEVGKQFPFSTVRPLATRLAFEEFWFFLSGKTQTKELEEKGCFFWTGNTTREFLDKRGLHHLEEGDMGKAYGAQLRGFGSSEFDQFTSVMNTLINDRYSRRLVTTLWNPEESHMMALTPCWFQHQFVVLPDKSTGEDVIHLKLSSRSLDLLLGERFGTQQYSLYLMAVAEMLGMKCGNLSCDLTHVHIYKSHIEFAKELVNRPLGKQGSLKINKKISSPLDILEMKWDDIEVSGLEVNKDAFKAPKPLMAV